MNNNRSMVPMESLIESISMGPFGSDVKVEYMQDTGIPVIDGSNLIGIKMNERSLRFMSPERVQPLKKSLAHRGDIIVTHRGTLGQIVYVPKNTQYEEYLISQSQFRISLKKDLVDPVYFTYYFHTSEGQKRLLSFANYVGVPALAQATTNFRKLEFPLVPMEQQKKVVSILTEIDDKIENNNTICAELEAMAKLLYDYWFVQFDFPDENGKPYKSSGGKMVWNEDLKREIPEGWAVAQLGDHISTNRGISYSSATLTDDGVPMVNLASFNVDSTYKVSGIKTYSGSYGKEQILKPYDLVMCNTQQTAIDPTKDIIGKTLLVPDIFDGDIVSSHHVTTIRTDNNAFKYYLNAESKTEWFHKYVAGFASGTNILGLDFNGVLNYRMPIPPQKLLNRFAELIHTYEAKKNESIKENTELASLRDFLIPLLLNGQVTFKEADCH